MAKKDKGMPEMVVIERIKTTVKKELEFQTALTILKNEAKKHVSKRHHKLSMEGFEFNGTDIIRKKED